MEELTVGELSARSGVAVSALHFYEKKGLITSRRTGGNQRRYRRDTLRRVALVRIHDVGEPAPEEEWLRANASVVREQRLSHASVIYFAVPPTRR